MVALNVAVVAQRFAPRFDELYQATAPTIPIVVLENGRNLDNKLSAADERRDASPCHQLSSVEACSATEVERKRLVQLEEEKNHPWNPQQRQRQQQRQQRQQQRRKSKKQKRKGRQQVVPEPLLVSPARETTVGNCFLIDRLVSFSRVSSLEKNDENMAADVPMVDVTVEALQEGAVCDGNGW